MHSQGEVLGLVWWFKSDFVDATVIELQVPQEQGAIAGEELNIS